MNNNSVDKKRFENVLTILGNKRNLNNYNRQILKTLGRKPSELNTFGRVKERRSVKPTPREILEDKKYIATQEPYVKKIKNITKKTKKN